MVASNQMMHVRIRPHCIRKMARQTLVTLLGPGGGPQVSIFNGNLNLVDAFFAFPQNFTGGVLASTTVNR